MVINQHTLDSIRNANLTGPNFATLFKQLAEGNETMDAPGSLLVLSYMDLENLPAEGELVPTITLALKPFHFLGEK